MPRRSRLSMRLNVIAVSALVVIGYVIYKMIFSAKVTDYDNNTASKTSERRITSEEGGISLTVSKIDSSVRGNIVVRSSLSSTSSSQ